MIASNKTTFKFPPRNDNVRGKWSAVYIEPMVGSGEKICIAVAVVNESGGLVVPVVALSRLECLYGKEANAILIAAEYVTNDLRTVLLRDGVEALNLWEPPMEGIYLGRISNGAGDSLESIARSALMMSASLVERLCEAEDSTNQGEKVSGNRLEELIKEKVISVKPNLATMFGLQRRVRENARAVTIGFVGNVIAANFGVLTPHSLSSNVKDIKSKLWDLANIRDDLGNNSLIPATINRYEMMFFRPADDAPEYSTRQIININEAVNELEAEADNKDIRCKGYLKYEIIADTLLEAEAA